MPARFGPRGASQILAISSTSARATIGTLPSTNPAIAITGLNAQTEAIYVKLGDNTVTAAATDAQRFRPGTPDDPLIIPVTASQTHVAILAEGAPGDVVITPGEMQNGIFGAVGASSTIAVTQTDARFALGTLGTSRPAISLVAMGALMGPVWVKLGDNTVTGSITTSMRIMPGSAEAPAVLRVTNSETHISIFCEGAPADIIMTPGNVSADTGLFLPLAGGNLTGSLTIQNGGSLTIKTAASTVAAEFLRLEPTDFGANKSYLFFKTSGTSDVWQIGTWDGSDIGGRIDFASIGLTQNGNEIVAPGSVAQGDVIYHNGTSWTRLGAGTSGQFLKTNGGGANPAWADIPFGATLIASGSFPAAATVDVTNIPATYDRLVVNISGASSNTATRAVLVSVSTNNGSSYDTTGANYPGWKVEDATFTLAALGFGSLAAGVTVTAAQTASMQCTIFNYQGGMNAQSLFRVISNTVNYHGSAVYIGSTSAINALRLRWDGTGNFDAGTYAIYGIR